MSFRLNRADNLVIGAFAEGKAGASSKLRSDGHELRTIGFPVELCAYWCFGIVCYPQASGRRCQTIQRAVKECAK